MNDSDESPEHSPESVPTIIERDHRPADPTVIEDNALPVTEGIRSTTLGPGVALGDWLLDRQLPVSSGEADLWLAHGPEIAQAVLKIYRFGIHPKEDIRERIQGISLEEVVAVYDVGLLPDGRHYEVLEYVRHGNLTDWARNGLNDTAIHRVLVELSKAVVALHEADVVHRDLKPDNILVRTAEPLEELDLVLTDFGISSVTHLSLHVTGIDRTPRYSAPEALTGVIHKKSDWWSVGVILLELLQGTHPFAGMSEQHVNMELATRGIDIPDDLPAEWRQLLRGLLTRDHAKRWGGKEVQSWMQGDREIAVYYERAGAVDSPARTSFVFNQREYIDPQVLAFDLAQNWSLAYQLLQSERLAQWLDEDLGNTDLALQVEAIRNDGRLEPELKVALTAMTLRPDMPLTWEGALMNREWLAGHVAQAERFLSGTGPQKVFELRQERIWLELRALKDQAIRRVQEAEVPYNRDQLIQLVVSPVSKIKEIATARWEHYMGSSNPTVDSLFEEGASRLEDLILVAVADRSVFLTGEQEKVQRIRDDARRLGITVDEDLVEEAARLEGAPLKAAAKRLRREYVDSDSLRVKRLLRNRKADEDQLRVLLACSRNQLVSKAARRAAEASDRGDQGLQYQFEKARTAIAYWNRLYVLSLFALVAYVVSMGMWENASESTRSTLAVVAGVALLIFAIRPTGAGLVWWRLCRIATRIRLERTTQEGPPAWYDRTWSEQVRRSIWIEVIVQGLVLAGTGHAYYRLMHNDYLLATVDINTNPTGLVISVNDSITTNSPVTLKLQPGNYTVTAKYSNWPPITKDFSLGWRGKEDIDLAFDYADFTVDSKPQGMAVSLEGGRWLGYTPLRLPRARGEFKLVASYRNWPKLIRKVVVVPERKRGHVFFEHERAFLAISCEEPGAVISENSEIVGKLPVVISRPAGSPYRFSVEHNDLANGRQKWAELTGFMPAGGLTNTLHPQWDHSGPLLLTLGTANRYGTANVPEHLQGRVFAWGQNWNERLNIPASLMNKGSVAVSAGNYPLVLWRNGTIWTWGGTRYSSPPALPQGLRDVVAVATADNRGVALRKDGRIVTWGEGEPPPPQLGRAIAIAAREDYNFVLQEDGTVVGWGDYMTHTWNRPPLTNIIAIAAADRHLVALSSEGIVHTRDFWNSTKDHSKGIRHELGKVRAIAAGAHHGVALRIDGTVATFRLATSPPSIVTRTTFGRDSATRSMPLALANVIAISAYADYSLALRENGTVVAWGSKYPIVPANLRGVVGISAGPAYAMAIISQEAYESP